MKQPMTILHLIRDGETENVTLGNTTITVSSDWVLYLLYLTATGMAETMTDLSDTSFKILNWIKCQYSNPSSEMPPDHIPNLRAAAARDFLKLREARYTDVDASLVVSMKDPDCMITTNGSSVKTSNMNDLLQYFFEHTRLNRQTGLNIWHDNPDAIRILCPLLDPNQEMPYWNYDSLSEKLAANTRKAMGYSLLPWDSENRRIEPRQGEYLPAADALAALKMLSELSSCYLAANHPLIVWLSPVVNRVLMPNAQVEKLFLRSTELHTVTKVIQEMEQSPEDDKQKRLLEKMANEQAEYREELLKKSPAEILDEGTAYNDRENIRLAVENGMLEEETIDALLAMEQPLKACYEHWLTMDHDILAEMTAAMEDLCDN